jgi:hypothetical protein
VQEPGLDRHDWQTEWEQLEPQLQDSPAEALPEVDRLVERMLRERGHDLDDPEPNESPEPEVIAGFREAHRITRLIESGEEVSPGDVGAAAVAYRELYDHMIEEHGAP